MAETKNSCYDCAYMRTVPWDAHIACGFDFRSAQKLMPKGDQHGIDNGWFTFPVNYDPKWMTSECQGFTTELDPDLGIDPFISLIQMMRG